MDLCHGIKGGVVGQQPSIQETANGPEISGSCTAAAGSAPHELLCEGQRAKGLLQQLCCAQKAPQLHQHKSGWLAIPGNPALHGCASFYQQQGAWMHRRTPRDFKDVLTTCYISWVKFTLHPFSCCYFDSEPGMCAKPGSKLEGAACFSYMAFPCSSVEAQGKMLIVCRTPLADPFPHVLGTGPG